VWQAFDQESRRRCAFPAAILCVPAAGPRGIEPQERLDTMAGRIGLQAQDGQAWEYLGVRHDADRAQGFARDGAGLRASVADGPPMRDALYARLRAHRL
jgi:hypothetical protein